MANASSYNGKLVFPKEFPRYLRDWFVKKINQYFENEYYDLVIHEHLDNKNEGTDYFFHGQGKWTAEDRFIELPKQFALMIRRDNNEEQTMWNLFKEELYKCPNKRIRIRYIDEEPGNGVLYSCDCEWFIKVVSDKYIIDYRENEETHYSPTPMGYAEIGMDYPHKLEPLDIVNMLKEGSEELGIPPVLDLTIKLFGVKQFLEDYCNEPDNPDELFYNEAIDLLLEKYGKHKVVISEKFKFDINYDWFLDKEVKA